VVASFLIAACSEPAVEKKQAMAFHVGNTIDLDLTDANLYFVQEDSYSVGSEPVRAVRGYVITDGTFVSGAGVDLADYNEATYVIVIGLQSKNNESIVTGNYYQNRDWNIDNYPNPATWNGTERLSFLGYKNTDNVTDPSYILVETVSDNDGIPNTNGNPVVITGGVEDGDTMVIKFNGVLDIWYASSGICCQTSSLMFKGKVVKTF